MREAICESKSTEWKELYAYKKVVSIEEVVLLTGKDWQELFSLSTGDTMVKTRRNQDDSTEFLLVLTQNQL